MVMKYILKWTLHILIVHRTNVLDKSHYNNAKLQDTSYSKNVLNQKISSNTCME